MLDAMLDARRHRPGRPTTPPSPRRCGWPPTAPPPGPATVVYPAETQQSSEPVLHRLRLRWLEAHLPGGRRPDLPGRPAASRPRSTRISRRPPASRSPTSSTGTEPDLRTSLVAVEPPTGYVRAFISGAATSPPTRSTTRSAGRAPAGSTAAARAASPARRSSRSCWPRRSTDGHHPRGPVLRRARTTSPRPAAPDAEGNHVVLEQLRRRALRHHRPARGHLAVGQHRVHPAHPRRRRGQGDGAGQGDGPHRRARLRARQVLRVGRARRRVRVAARHGVGLRRVRRPRRCGPSRRRCCGSPTATARCSSTTPSPPTTRILKEDVADNVTDILQGVLERGTAAGRGLRPPGGRQDRHHPGQQGRLVRRLHADAVDRGVDGLPERGRGTADEATCGHQGRRPRSPAAPTRPGSGRPS